MYTLRPLTPCTDLSVLACGTCARSGREYLPSAQLQQDEWLPQATWDESRWSRFFMDYAPPGENHTIERCCTARCQV
jgi:hypothetical protein